MSTIEVASYDRKKYLPNGSLYLENRTEKRKLKRL